MGGTAYLRSLDGVVYYAAAFRNAGTGLAVIHGWAPASTRLEATAPAPAVDDFRPMTLDIYVPAGESAAWMAAVRETDSDLSRALRAAAEADQPLSVDLLYGDGEGGQRTITRFGFVLDPDAPDEPAPDRPPGVRTLIVIRHWNLDRPDPRREPTKMPEKPSTQG